MLQRRQCEKKNQNHQGVPQPCLEWDTQNVREIYIKVGWFCCPVKKVTPKYMATEKNLTLEMLPTFFYGCLYKARCWCWSGGGWWCWFTVEVNLEPSSGLASLHDKGQCCREPSLLGQLEKSLQLTFHFLLSNLNKKKWELEEHKNTSFHFHCLNSTQNGGRGYNRQQQITKPLQHLKGVLLILRKYF